MWKLCLPPPLLKFLAAPLSAVFQHFSNQGSKFQTKVAAKDFQDCDSIILNHSFTLLFAFCKLSFKKRLLKFDQELSVCWKKVTVYAIGYQRTGRILLATFR